MQVPFERKNLVLDSSQTTGNQIPRVSVSTLNPQIFWNEYRRAGKPVIITDLLDNQPKWDLNYLCEKLGDQKFPIRVYGNKRYQQDKRQWEDIGSSVKYQAMTLNDYAEKLRNGEAAQQDMYLGKCALTNTTLAADSGLRNLGSRLGFKLPVTGLNLWCGNGGHTTCLHSDAFDGILTQLSGSKKVLLFPPKQLSNIYPFLLFNHLRYGLKIRSSYSQVYPQKPDLESFPKFSQALTNAYEVTLQEGDVLFIPVGWWHEVTALGDGVVISVNQFWNVFPLSRAMFSWNKWRIHLTIILAAPHIIATWLKAIMSSDRKQKLRQLMQKF
ncbi:MAG: cupin-like domain-containing protein [Cyanobacteria bacterium P01_A01_bin.84]